MFSSKLWRIFTTVLTWAVVWGLVGAMAGVAMTIIEPDTGHVPPLFVPVMVGVPSAVFGASAGLLFAVAATSQLAAALGRKGRMVIGGVVGGFVGVVFTVVAHSVVTILLAVILGAALGSRFVEPEALG